MINPFEDPLWKHMQKSTNYHSFQEKYQEIITDWGKKAELVDYILELDNIHDGKPVSVKGWKGIGFSSAKDFAFVRLMSQLEVATKDRKVANEKINAIKNTLRVYGTLGDTYDYSELIKELWKILKTKGIDIIRWNLYPKEYPRDPLFPTLEEYKP